MTASISSLANAEEVQQAESQTIEAPSASDQPAFWFQSAEGTRTFDVSENVIVPHVLKSDSVRIEGNLINTYDANDGLVGSIKADLPEGVALKFANGVIYAGSTDGVANRCIENKWVGLGINVAADALVCAPVGAATGGAGGFACGAAVGAGVTAASC
ncbi:MAG: hypothetical protein ACHEUT_08300 [Corynebacterium pyruviciproducens]